MNDAILSYIFQGILGFVILPYVLWQLTHKSHKSHNITDKVKFMVIYIGLFSAYFILPDFLKLLYLVTLIFMLNYKFFKLNLVQSLLTSFIFIVIFITSEIVSEMVAQILNIVIDNFISNIGYLDSIKFALQSLVCIWMIRSFKQEFSTLIVNRGPQN
ncbi:MAG TPA: hypothetical protein VLS94_04620 [Fusibacter sp.]|nr:hypothetical protein [Fusibacter sp.]